MVLKITTTVAAVITVLLVGLLGCIYMQQQSESLSLRSITVAGNSVHVEVASSEAAREQGLSGRQGMPADTGMLFVFDRENKWGIWMKDMLFSIDIVWADSSGKIVYIAQNVAPESYPTIFAPKTAARYVLELPAGYVAEHGVAVDTKIVI